MRDNDPDTWTQAKAVLAALDRDDLDAAIEAGLMTCPLPDGTGSPGMTDVDLHRIAAARTQRTLAWDARDRFNRRNLRVAERKHARESAHREKLDTTTRLPPAASDALARARLRAATRKPAS